ncbi:MAG TPA: hypothetical protein G4N92_03580 [Anaerolineae bacterium]|nr:hypothetical protein [Anaerolineae bacterium]
MAGERIGEVSHFYGRISVAVINLSGNPHQKSLAGSGMVSSCHSTRHTNLLSTPRLCLPYPMPHKG